MLIEFAIEPAALDNLSSQNLRTVKAQHEIFIRQWKNYGILKNPATSGESLVAKIKDLPLNVRDLWMVAWKHNPRSEWRQLINWEQIESPRQLSIICNDIALVFVEEYRGEIYLEIPSGDYRTTCGNVEAVIFPYIDQSDAFRNASELSSKVIPAGQAVDDLWSERFLKFAEYVKHIVIIDRYGLTHNNIEGLLKFLRFLNRDASPNCNISIYASHPSTVSPKESDNEILHILLDQLVRPDWRLRSVAFFWVPNYRMTMERYVRFGKYSFTLGHELSEIFKGDYVPRNIPCVLDSSYYDTIQGEIDKHRTQQYTILRFRYGQLIQELETIQP